MRGWRGHAVAKCDRPSGIDGTFSVSAPESLSVDRMSRAARNQSLYREINERIEGLNESFASVTENSEWICECANTSCVEMIAMSLHEYEAVRRDPRHFLVRPDDAHVWPDVERVVQRSANYWVVEKVGESGKLADRLDPRT